MNNVLVCTELDEVVHAEIIVVLLEKLEFVVIVASSGLKLLKGL